MKSGKLKAAALRMTPQRAAILAFLGGNTAHPSADDIYLAVKERYPTMSFATVYNTLQALKRVGGVRELRIDATRRRYDPNTRAHHHLICEVCGRIVDIHADYDLAIPQDVADAFDVADCRVEFFGTCHPCRDETSRSRGVLQRATA